jgi:hypothetical protein
MLSRNLFGGALTAAFGGVVLILAATPAPAFTLSAPSLNQSVLNTGVEKVWWYRWGYGTDLGVGAGGLAMASTGRDRSVAAGEARWATCTAAGDEG